MAVPRWISHEEARENGWFSRRHRTDAEHRAAREKFKATRGKAARKRRAQERLLEEAA